VWGSLSDLPDERPFNPGATMGTTAVFLLTLRPRDGARDLDRRGGGEGGMEGRVTDITPWVKKIT